MSEDRTLRLSDFPTEKEHEKALEAKKPLAPPKITSIWVVYGIHPYGRISEPVAAYDTEAQAMAAIEGDDNLSFREVSLRGFR